MRLFLWQQWASNHSSDFTIIGEFASVEAAQKAAVELEAMLLRIRDWHYSHPEESQDLWDFQIAYEQGSPVEEELAARYGIAWRRAIDWFESPEVITLGNLLLAGPGDWRPEDGGQPVDQLVACLGARQVFLDSYEYGTTLARIYLTLRCMAPDEETAGAIQAEYPDDETPTQVDGRLLLLDRWEFIPVRPLPAFLQKLEELGCTEIEYSFEQWTLPQGLPWMPRDDVVEPETYPGQAPTRAQLLRDLIRQDRDPEMAMLTLLIQDELPLTDLLVETLSTHPAPYIRERAAKALQERPDSAAIPALITALDDRHGIVRVAAVSALALFPEPRVAEALVRALPDRDCGEAAAWALGRMGEVAEEALRQATARELGYTPLPGRLLKEAQAAGELLIRLRSLDGAAREAALAQIETEKRIDVLLAYLHNPSSQRVLRRVIALLGQIGDASHIPELMVVLAQAPSYAAEALAEIGPEAIPQLREIAISRESRWYVDDARYIALRALIRLGDLHAADTLVDSVSKTWGWEWRENALLLVDIHYPDVERIIIEAFWHTTRTYGERYLFHTYDMVSVLRRIRPQGPHPLLPSLLDSLGSDEFIWASATTLALIGDPVAIPALEAALERCVDSDQCEQIESALERLKRSGAAS